jgi:hypothetical protein
MSAFCVFISLTPKHTFVFVLLINFTFVHSQTLPYGPCNLVPIVSVSAILQ